jgi:hypothetical protein|tara:strand:+ start:511 stop:909 length:399 start_codon:yes stop_codon:yes gene_type:complete
MAVKLEELVKAYIAIRNKRDANAREFNAKDSELKAELAQLDQVMLSSCNEIEADSIKTNSGTIIKTTKENFVCGDWDNFKQYVMQNDAIELLQQRLHQTNFKEFLSNRTDEGLPPGISSMKEFQIVVRKPSK